MTKELYMSIREISTVRSLPCVRYVPPISVSSTRLLSAIWKDTSKLTGEWKSLFYLLLPLWTETEVED